MELHLQRHSTQSAACETLVPPSLRLLVGVGIRTWPGFRIRLHTRTHARARTQALTLFFSLPVRTRLCVNDVSVCLCACVSLKVCVCMCVCGLACMRIAGECVQVDLHNMLEQKGVESSSPRSEQGRQHLEGTNPSTLSTENRDTHCT